jgi:hypothetical protein
MNDRWENKVYLMTKTIRRGKEMDRDGMGSLLFLFFFSPP